MKVIGSGGSAAAAPSISSVGISALMTCRAIERSRPRRVETDNALGSPRIRRQVEAGPDTDFEYTAMRGWHQARRYAEKVSWRIER